MFSELPRSTTLYYLGSPNFMFVSVMPEIKILKMLLQIVEVSPFDKNSTFVSAFI